MEKFLVPKSSTILMMEAVTYTHALNNLATMIDKVGNDHVPIIITKENQPPVIMVSLEDFNVWQETLYLTRSPANAKDLLEAVEEIKQNKNIVKHNLIEE